MNKSLITLALILSVVTAGAQAEHRSLIDRANLNANAQGSFTRQTEQRNTDNGFVRDITRTNAQGETATRNVIVARDSEAGTSMRSVSGITADGREYSGESLLSRTDDGFTRDSTMTSPEGQTRTRSADVSVNKEEGSLTKHISTTSPNGEVTTTTVVKQRNRETSTAAAE